jgi:flagellar basal body rod protein FlgC
MSDLINQIEALLANDMRAVELAAFKIANANRPLQGVGSELFVDRLNGGSEQFVLTDSQASDQAERVSVRRVYQPESPSADDAGFVDYLDVDLAHEMIQINLHKRSYELGIRLYNSAKSMNESALNIGKDR